MDVWSLGATVWEMAETEPPFADMQQVDDRWPPLSRPEIYSPAFRDFLRQCSEPPATRPTASELKKVSSSHPRFYNNLTFDFRAPSLTTHVDALSSFNFFLNVWPLSRRFGMGRFRMDPLRNSMYTLFVCINLIGFHSYLSISQHIYVSTCMLFLSLPLMLYDESRPFSTLR